MNSIYSDELTKKEKEVMKAIIFEGLDVVGLMSKFCLQRCTIITHINAICQKLQIYGNSRLYEIKNKFWEEFLTMNNCKECDFENKENCTNPKSQYFNDKGSANRYQICREFKQRCRNKSDSMAECVENDCEGCRYGK